MGWPHSSEAKRKDPICFSPHLYRPCNLVERFLKNSDASRREDAGPYLKLEFVIASRWLAMTASCSRELSYNNTGCSAAIASPTPMLPLAITSA
jgi:hypothetical protein